MGIDLSVPLATVSQSSISKGLQPVFCVLYITVHLVPGHGLAESVVEGGN